MPCRLRTVWHYSTHASRGSLKALLLIYNRTACAGNFCAPQPNVAGRAFCLPPMLVFLVFDWFNNSYWFSFCVIYMLDNTTYKLYDIIMTTKELMGIRSYLWFIIAL